jgi:hypothetical protein
MSSSSSTPSPSGHRDKQLRIFDFKKGKMKRRYSESVETYQVCGVLRRGVCWGRGYSTFTFSLYWRAQKGRDE